MFIIKAEEHFWVVEITVIFYLLCHWIQQGLIKKNFMDFESYVAQAHDDPIEFIFNVFKQLFLFA